MLLLNAIKIAFFFFKKMTGDKQADIIDAFNTTSSYLDGILNVNNIYFDNMVSSELQLNKANTSDTEVSFLICICSFLMILFLPTISHLYFVMFHELHLMEFIFLNSSHLLEHLAMLQTQHSQ